MSPRRHPVPEPFRRELMRTAEGRALLTEPIRGRSELRSLPDQPNPKESTMAHDDYELSEAQVCELLNLSPADLGNVELMLHMDGRARPERGPGLWFSRSLVERAQAWLAERQAAPESAAELLLAEGGHPPQASSAEQKADQIALEAKAMGIELGYGPPEERTP